MSSLFDRMRKTMEPTDDNIWAPVPESLANRIKEWQTMLADAVQFMKITDDLCICMIQGLFNLEGDLRLIIAESSRMTPAIAMIRNCLQVRRINEIESSVVLVVDCPELQAFRGKLSDQIAYPIDTITGKWEAVIEIARFENAIGDIQEVNDIEAHGIAGEKFIIDHVCVGTKDSYCECAMLGHAPLTFSDGERIDGHSLKATGMSTLDGESGGFLTGELPDEYQDDEEDDDVWMLRAMGLTEVLDEGY